MSVQMLPECEVCGREGPICSVCKRCGDASCNSGCIFCVNDSRPFWQRLLPGKTRQADRTIPVGGPKQTGGRVTREPERHSYIVTIEVAVIAEDQESAKELAFTNRWLDQAEVVDVQDEGVVV